MDDKRTVLHNCIVVTVDDKDRCYGDGMVAFEGGEIVYVGEIKKPRPGDRLLDMGGKIVMPGLVNTHTHSPAALFRGFADDLYLMDWLQNHMWPVEHNMTAEHAYRGACLSYLEYLYNGMTTNVDMWYYASAVARAAMHVGLRAVVAAGVFSWPSPESEDSLQAADDFVAAWRDKTDQTLVYPCYGPHDAYSCDKEKLADIAELAARRDVMVHTHISETQQNNRELMEREGVSPTWYFQQAGIFERRVLGAHCIWLSDEDIDIFKQAGAAVSYNPVSNMKLCDGVLPAHRLRAAGVPITLGVDGAQSNNSLDLLADLKTGVLLQKVTRDDPTFFPARQAVRMVTIDGAAALGMEQSIGSLEVGKQADIITLDTRSPNLTPCHPGLPGQLYSHLTYSATGGNVSDVFVAGRQLMQDHKPLHINAEDILAEAQKASAELYQLWKQKT